LNDKNVIFIAGYPGAGKGTISQRYCLEYKDAYHISAGDLIRDVIAGKSKSDFKQALITTGDKKTKTSPAWVIAGIMKEKIHYEDYRLYLLDGFPQRYEELVSFANDSDGITIIGSVFFNSSIDTCVDRMIGRGMRNLEVFDKTLSEPELIPYYQQRYTKYQNNAEQITEILNNFDLKTLDANPKIPIVYEYFKTIVSNFNQRKK
jgi:adenylate kinase family enzyme